MWNVLRPVLILVSAIHSSVERVTQPLLADLDTITDTSPLKVTTPSRPCSPSRVDRHRAREGRAHQTLLSVAVAADLRSLPSLLKSPPARPLPTASNSLPEKQEFGPPSNVYYEHRLPFVNVTNLPRFGAEQKGIKLDNFQVKASAPRVKSKSREQVSSRPNPGYHRRGYGSSQFCQVSQVRPRVRHRQRQRVRRRAH
ncbi:hypothetical protein C8R47DRAFT_85418 [Mycena vitilis]|nr:hypothetical protein C8R47DRAFT_85418 [Mycena vitilis]